MRVANAKTISRLADPFAGVDPTAALSPLRQAQRRQQEEEELRAAMREQRHKDPQHQRQKENLPSRLSQGPSFAKARARSLEPLRSQGRKQEAWVAIRSKPSPPKKHMKHKKVTSGTASQPRVGSEFATEGSHMRPLYEELPPAPRAGGKSGDWSSRGKQQLRDVERSCAGGDPEAATECPPRVGPLEEIPVAMDDIMTDDEMTRLVARDKARRLQRIRGKHQLSESGSKGFAPPNETDVPLACLGASSLRQREAWSQESALRQGGRLHRQKPRSVVRVPSATAAMITGYEVGEPCRKGPSQHVEIPWDASAVAGAAQHLRACHGAKAPVAIDPLRSKRRAAPKKPTYAWQQPTAATKVKTVRVRANSVSRGAGKSSLAGALRRELRDAARASQAATDDAKAFLREVTDRPAEQPRPRVPRKKVPQRAPSPIGTQQRQPRKEARDEKALFPVASKQTSLNLCVARAESLAKKPQHRPAAPQVDGEIEGGEVEDDESGGFFITQGFDYGGGRNGADEDDGIVGGNKGFFITQGGGDASRVGKEAHRMGSGGSMGGRSHAHEPSSVPIAGPPPNPRIAVLVGGARYRRRPTERR